MWKYFLAGGMIMWPLLFLSICSLALIIERLTFWRNTRMKPDLLKTQAFLRNFKQDKQLTLTPAGPFSSLVHAGLTQPDAAPKAMEAIALEQLAFMNRRMGLLDTIITASPLLGILGTVLGIIEVFDMLGSANGSNPAAITAGLAQALITTAAGLLIALMTLFPFNYFQNQIEFATTNMEKLAAQLESILQSSTH